MGERIKKLKKIRIHREGTDELLYTLFALIAIGVILWRSFNNPIPFIIFMAIFGSAWLLMLNFYLFQRQHREDRRGSGRRKDRSH